MATINYTDIPNSSHRNSINKKKRNKGVKRGKNPSYVEEKFWKRARNIRFQKQSRVDNYYDYDYDYDCDDDYDHKTETVAEPIPPLVGFEETADGNQVEISVYHHDPTQIIPGTTEAFEGGLLYGPLNEDTLEIGFGSNINILSTKRNIEHVLRLNKVAFDFDADGAIWTCRSDDHLFFLRLWIRDKTSIVIEPIVGMGGPDTFANYYYYDLFAPFFW